MPLCLFLALDQPLWGLLRRIWPRNTEDKSDAAFSTSSPIFGQGIVINIFSPPEDQYSTESSLSRNPGSMISHWESDKDQFLRNPTLSRLDSPNPEIRPQLTATPTVIMPSKWSDMCIPTQNHSECQLSESCSSQPDTATLCFSGSGSTALSQSPLSSTSPWKTSMNTSSSLCPTSDHSSPSLNSEVADRNDKMSVVDFGHARQARNNAEGDSAEGPAGLAATTSDKVFQVTFAPIRYPLNALSAASGFLSDPPHFSSVATVPIPFLTDTPPKPLSRMSFVQGPRISLLPYPDLFDFAMYHSRASQEVDPVFDFSNFSSDITLPKPPTPPASKVAHQSRYASRTTVVSRFAGLCTPPKADRITRKTPVSRSHRHPISDVSISSIAFNSPAKPSLAFAQTGVNYVPLSSPDTSGEWNLISSDEIHARLRVACEDLSRCMWTEEEFLKIIS
ncbi:hypothetical protein Hypma_007898 [Hypsizygus marmoreus]|uniref:Uncharacterized protein n=1 Tax=Hypsizygus marmoreus TaxID=39966 RepID=A0A369K0G1_HYPMA|nr:hypothetical protein Hypma_007898 [Hypsizygus marmoreus]